MFYNCPVPHSISPRFVASFLAEIYPSRCPFFPASWLIFLFSGYFLVFLSLLSTPHESDCKTERKNSRGKSDCNCLFVVPPKNVLLLPSSPFDFAMVFGQFFGRNLPVAPPFFSSLFLTYFPVFWLFFGHFFVFLSLLSTPHESDCKTERKHSRRKRQ